MCNGLQKLADLFEELEKTSSGNKMREILSDFFKSVPEDDIAVISYLTLGRIASEYEGVVLGIAEKSALKAIAKTAGVDETKVKENHAGNWRRRSDGRKTITKKPQTLVPMGKLTVKELFEKLHKITNTIGTGSQEEKLTFWSISCKNLLAKEQNTSSG